MTKTLWIAGMAAIVFAGCSGDAAVTSGLPCSTPAVPSIALLLPLNGATGVSPAIGMLDFAEGFAGGSQTTIDLSSSAGAITAGTLTPVPNGVPFPIQTANPGVPYIVTIPALASATTYTITAEYAFGVTSSSCPTSATITVGSFTTH